MKFKQSDRQNQRLERITTSHLVIGIDIAKETHVAQATNFRGIVLTNRHLSFKKNTQGTIRTTLRIGWLGRDSTSFRESSDNETKQGKQG